MKKKEYASTSECIEGGVPVLPIPKEPGHGSGWRLCTSAIIPVERVETDNMYGSERIERVIENHIVWFWERKVSQATNDEGLDWLTDAVDNM